MGGKSKRQSVGKSDSSLEELHHGAGRPRMHHAGCIMSSMDIVDFPYFHLGPVIRIHDLVRPSMVDSRPNEALSSYAQSPMPVFHPVSNTESRFV